VYKQYAGATLQHYQDEVTEIKHGNECGIGLDFKDIRPGDVVECYTRAEVKQEL
jgi:translation initiation factor IF-2